MNVIRAHAQQQVDVYYLVQGELGPNSGWYDTFRKLTESEIRTELAEWREAIPHKKFRAVKVTVVRTYEHYPEDFAP